MGQPTRLPGYRFSHYLGLDLGHNEDRLGHNEDRLGHNEDRLGHNEDRLGHNEDRLGHNEDRLETRINIYRFLCL
jgi:hypothetical protein